MQSAKILFLYTELGAYTLACMESLIKKTKEVHVIRFPVNNEAPFEFETKTQIHFYERKDYNFENLKNLVQQINPSIIICSGWIDKEYLKICSLYKSKIPTVLTIDTHWRGDLKQNILRLISPFTLKRNFTYAWVPGQIQKTYAEKLGFKSDKIFTGFYCADIKLFNSIYEKTIPAKKEKFPKRFLYIGRYYDFKGLPELWQAFIDWQNETPNDWELWCLGTGTLEPSEHPKIKHFGFVQPENLTEFISKTGVFILPSRFEPWAVTVQEFACAGYPLICSDAVGAASHFIEPNHNGYIFKKENVIELKKMLSKINSLSNAELISMCELSHKKGQTITTEMWTNTISKILKNAN